MTEPRVLRTPENPHYPVSHFLDGVNDTVQPPERISVSEAVERYRVVNNPGSYVGPYLNSTTPYMREPADILDSRDFTAEIFVGPAQSGKTDTFSQNWLTYSVKCSPADLALVCPTINSARDFSRRRTDRLLRHSPEVGSQLLPGKTNDSVLVKQFRSGMILTHSYPSVSELAGKSLPRISFNDYDRMEQNIGGEGSPFQMGRQRIKTFGSFGMVAAESTPGFPCTDPKWRPPKNQPHMGPPCEGGIVALYNTGDRRRWFWPCLHCGEFYKPEFDLLVYPDTDDFMEAAEQAVMVCPHCGGVMEHGRKHEVNQRGVWVPEGQHALPNGKLEGKARSSTIASFWLKGVSAAFASWKGIVFNYLNAMREYEDTNSEESLKVVVNTDLGEVYTPRTAAEARSPEDIMDGAVDLGERLVPPGCRGLLATIDVQKWKFVVQVTGLMDTGDYCLVDRFDVRKSARLDEDGERFPCDPASYSEDWHLIEDEVINKTYPLDDASGRYMQIKMTACDSGGRSGVTENAYKFYKRLKKRGMANRFQLVKGASLRDAPRVKKSYPDSERKDRYASARGEVPVLFINGNLVKDMLSNIIGRTEQGGRMLFPDWLELEFYKELCVEAKNQKGLWERVKKGSNEATDLCVYFLALVIQLKVENVTFDSPPAWLKPWDDNPLVAGGTAPAANAEPVKKRRSLKDLGSRLA